MNLVPKAPIYCLAPGRHASQHLNTIINVVVDDHLALGMVLPMQSADILGEGPQDMGIVRNRMSKEASSKPSSR